MDLLLTLADQSADDVRSLHSWLNEEEDLRGRARLRPAPVPEGKLGSLTDALIVAIGPGGAAVSLAGVLISWIRHRTTDVVLEASRPDGEKVRITARRVKGLDVAEIKAVTNGLAAWAGGQGEAPPELTGPES